MSDKDDTELRYSMIELGAPPPEPAPVPEPLPADATTTRTMPAMKLERTACHHFGPAQISDGVERAVCSDCGCDLNPYVLLRQIAHKEINFCYSLDRLRKEAKELADEVKELKAIRSRLRSELKKSVRHAAEEWDRIKLEYAQRPR